MKQQEMIVLGLAALAVYMLYSAKKKGTSDGSKSTDFVGEILDGSGKLFANGWRYFDNGTSIDPSGNYYFQGQLVWKAE